VQPSLLPAYEVPLRVELMITREWVRLLTHSGLAQYLPLGELLGAIPGDQASGAWARCIGLALVNLWRRQPKAIMAGTLRPTRHELLDHYLPKTALPEEILSSTNPFRARKYWSQALGILCENGFLAPEGEVITAREAAKRGSVSRQGWKRDWLQEEVYLRPGPKMLLHVQTTEKALGHIKPRDLRAPNRRGGRPRKATT
jgi:hypothetical protein